MPGAFSKSELTSKMYRAKEKTGAACGLDLGLKDFITSSEGKTFKNHRYRKKYAAPIRLKSPEA